MNVEASLDSIPEPAVQQPAPSRIGGWFAAAGILSFVSSVLFRKLTLHWSLTFALALLPLPALAGLVLAARRAARGMDELERRVQMEALTWSFGIAGIAFLLFNQLQVADLLGPEDWFMPWIAIWGAYVLSVAAARKRYT
jgi:hypothetical protein